MREYYKANLLIDFKAELTLQVWIAATLSVNSEPMQEFDKGTLHLTEVVLNRLSEGQLDAQFRFIHDTDGWLIEGVPVYEPFDFSTLGITRDLLVKDTDR